MSFLNPTKQVKRKPTKKVKPAKNGIKSRYKKSTLSSGDDAAYSLYSTDSEDPGQANKDLDRCAKLLAVMLDKDNACGAPKGQRNQKNAGIPRRHATNKHGNIVTKKKTSNVNGQTGPKIGPYPKQVPQPVNTSLPTAFNQRLVSSTPEPFQGNDQVPERDVVTQVGREGSHAVGRNTANSSQGVENYSVPTVANGHAVHGHSPLRNQVPERDLDTSQRVQYDFQRLPFTAYQSPDPNMPYASHQEQTLPFSAHISHHNPQHKGDAYHDNAPVHIPTAESLSPASHSPPVKQTKADNSGVLKSQTRQENNVSRSNGVIGAMNMDTENNHNPPAATETVPFCSSPQDVDQHLRMLKYLMGELRTVAKMGGDVEIQRLVGEMSNIIRKLTCGTVMASQTDIDLALQPLRSENSQLRRRLRIANQQLRNIEEKEVKESSNYVSSFEAVHLQATKIALEKQLKQSRASESQLEAQVLDLENRLEELEMKKRSMMEVLGNKDTDQLKLRQDWLRDTNKLKADLNFAQNEQRSVKLKMEAVDQENHILQITLQQRDAEIGRLQDLVRNLQDSMSELLLNIQSNNLVTTAKSKWISEVPVNGTVWNSAPHMVKNEDINAANVSSDELDDTLKHDDMSDVAPLPSRQAWGSHTKELRQDLPVVGQSKTFRTEPVGADRTVDRYAGQQISAKPRMMERIEERSEHETLSSKNNSSSSDKDLERYSLRSYFKQYDNTPLTDPVKANQNVVSDLETGFVRGRAVNTEGLTRPRQNIVYIGTELDTSQSTIDDTHSVTSQSTTSWTSADDEAFRSGLANLDANIAKLQQTLRCTLQR